MSNVGLSAHYTTIIFGEALVSPAYMVAMPLAMICLSAIIL